MHARVIVSGKGSRFFLCKRSATDPSFPKYPPLPVVQCRGYEITVSEVTPQDL